MTDEQRDAIVDLVLFGLGAAAAIYVLRTPPLRRAAFRLLKYGLFTAAPSALWQETAKAWRQSARS